MTTKRQCAEPGTNHSKDLFTVFDGHPKPTVLCGFHEQQRHFAAEANNRKVQAAIAAALAKHPCLPT